MRKEDSPTRIQWNKQRKGIKLLDGVVEEKERLVLELGAVGVEVGERIDANGEAEGVEEVALHDSVPDDDALSVGLAADEDALEEVGCGFEPRRHGGEVEAFWNAVEGECLFSGGEAEAPGDAEEECPRERGFELEEGFAGLAAVGTGFCVGEEGAS